MRSLETKTNQPLIAISTRAEDYCEWVVRWGGQFRLVSIGGDRSLDGVSGLLLTGGEDVAPALYGQDNRHCQRVNSERDEFELELLQIALDRSLPVLAVCRGMQLLCAALGGTLYQDLSEFNSSPSSPTAIIHRGPNHTDTVHPLRVEPETMLYGLFGGAAMVVNSHHHQGVSQLPRRLRACSFSPEGLIEAVEDIEGRFVLGVQWHPERWEHASSEKLMKGFLSAAERRR